MSNYIREGTISVRENHLSHMWIWGERSLNKEKRSVTKKHIVKRKMGYSFG